MALAINASAIAAPWAALMYACDGIFWDVHGGMAGFPGIRITQDAVAAARHGLMHLPGDDGQGLCLAPERIHFGNNSGFQCINLARHLLAGLPDARLLLLGFDFRRGGDGRSHHHGDHAPPLLNPLDADLARWLPHFTPLPAQLQADGIAVVNCSAVSALECFPRGRLADCLQPDP